MRVALIADVHSNLPALEAVLHAIKKHSPDRIISLGDQVNLGPCPRETLELLRAENVACLHGNHERYILSVLRGDPGYEGANFDNLRFNAERLTAQEITFPKTIELGGVTLTHALPDNDRFPVFEPETAIPLLEQMQPDKPTHIICGHGHNPTHLRVGNLMIDSIGSVGCMDDGIPGSAPYTILTLKNGHAALRPYDAPYDVRRLKPLFISSGMAEYCPTMAHIICVQMTLNIDVLCGFVARAQALSKARGEAFVSPETWRDVDRDYPWPDGIPTDVFF